MRTSRRKIGSGSRTRTGDCFRERKVFKPSKLFWKEQLLYASLEQVTGLEPVPSAWQAEILTDYTIPAYGFSGARVGRALLYTTAPENGADSPIRTDVDFRLVVTNHVQSTTMRYRQIYINTHSSSE